MLESLNSLAQYSPFLAQIAWLILVVIALLVCWFVLSLPFALLHWGADPRLRASIGVVDRLLHSLVAFIRSRRTAANQPMAHFVELVRLSIIHTEQNRSWQTFARQVEASVSTLEARTVNAIKGLALETNRHQITADNLRYPDLQQPDIEIPDVTEYQEAHKAGRAGWTRFSVSALLVVLLFTLNSGMLKLFFDGLVPGYLVFSLGIKVSHGIAMLFSMVEVSLGVLLFWFGRKDSQDEVRQLLVEIIIYVSICLLALIELYLYFKLSLEISGAPISDWQTLTFLETLDAVWISPFGPVIVVALFMCGHILMDGFDRIRSAGDTADILGKFRSLDALVKNFNNTIDQLNEGMKRTSDTAVRLGNDLSSIETADPLISGQIIEGISNWEKAVEANRDIFTSPYLELDEREVKLAYYQNLGYLAGVVTILVTFVISQQAFLRRLDFLPDLEWSYPIIASVEALLMLLVGHVDAERRIISIGQPELRLLPSAGIAMTRYGSYAIMLAIALFVSVITLMITAKPSWAAWTLQLGCVAGLFVLGRNLRLLWLALWSSLLYGAIAVAITLAWALYGMLVAVHLFLQIVRFFIAVGSIPCLWLVGLFFPLDNMRPVPKLSIPRGGEQ